MTIMSKTYDRRLLGLADAQEDAKVDVVSVVPGANLRYLTGLEMHTSERITLALLPVGQQPIFVIPELEAPRAEAHLGVQASLHTYTDQQGPGAAFRQVAADLQLRDRVVAVEYLQMRVLELRLLEEYAANSTFVDGQPLLSELRILKDDEEIETMRRAAAVNEECFRQAAAHIRPGVTEQELAAIWQKAALDRASGELPEVPIVALRSAGVQPVVRNRHLPPRAGR